MRGDKARASAPYNLSGYSFASRLIGPEALNAIADVSFLLESFVRTISKGIPGFTSAALMYSVPRSIPRTADWARAEGASNRRKRAMKETGAAYVRRLSRGAIVCVITQWACDLVIVALAFVVS